MSRRTSIRNSAVPLYVFTSAILMTLGIRNSHSAENEQPKPEKSLAEEMKRLPAVEAEDAAGTLAVQDKFRMVQVASEPLMGDPVDGCFDASGRMFVAEMHGYPYSFEKRKQQPEGGGKKDAGIIRLLEDTDDDGTFDKSYVYADKISWPTSVCCYDGGVFALAPDKLYYFKDTDGDNRADVREVIFTGFGRQNVQGLANNLKWGLDHRIYGSVGSNGANLTRDGKPFLNLGRRDFAYDPATGDVEPLAGGVQFGHSMDDSGHRFVCSNSNHIRHVVFPLRYLERNPSLSTSGNVRSIAKEGGAAPVFRKSPAEPWRIVRTRRRAADPKYNQRLPHTELVPIGFFTSAVSVSIYRGDAYPPKYYGNVFVGDVGGNLVHRKILTPDGSSFVATRADQDVEFVTSTDTWFRPTNFVNAPDGTLYVLDMYRETIEHPVSIPEDIKAFVDLESGDNRGRVWRLEPPSFKHRQTPDLASMSSAKLVPLLAHPNAWHRETAHRLLWERQDKAVASAVRKLLQESDAPLGRLHALWTLEGLDSISNDDLERGLTDSDPEVVAAAIRIAEPRGVENQEIQELVVATVKPNAQPVIEQLALTLGEWKSDIAAAEMLTISPKCQKGDLRTAWLSSVTPHAATIMKQALKHSDAGSNGLIAETARTLGVNGSDYEIQAVIDQILQPENDLDQQIALLLPLAEGLRLRNKSLQSVAKSGQSGDIAGRVEAFFQAVAERAGNDKLSVKDRQNAVRMLGYADQKLALPVLVELLSPATPVSLQQASIESMTDLGADAAADAVIAAFTGLSPNLKKEVTESLLSRQSWTKKLLAAIGEKKIPSVEMPREQKDILLNHPKDDIRQLARKVLSAEVAGERGPVVKKYRTGLSDAGDADHGKALFKKHCSACHKVGDVGHNVGPEIASVKNKSAEDLLIAIMDPSREAQSNFLSYTVVTDEGRVLTGLIASESSEAITLRQPEGKETIVLRSQIDVLRSNGISLMPVGLEKELKPSDINDLIAYIKSLKAPATSE
jgi:putative membrane-bound dehydrogenase-like protein